jgi:hypothetical protein
MQESAAKAISEEEVPIMPKKRGRKPKNRDITNEKIITAPSEEKQEDKILATPKKSFFMTKIENTILHFPIKGNISKGLFDECSKNNIFTQNNESVGPIPYDPNMYINMHADFENASHSFAFVPPELEIKKSIGFTAINKTVKIVPLLGEFTKCNESRVLPEKTNVCCFWDTEPFENPPVGLPERKEGDTFFVKHCFCSFNCMASFNFSLNDEKMWERYALINLMYKKQYNLNQNIKIQLAPPREALIKFGGVYDIVKFRELNKEKSIKIMSFPIISIQTYLEEMNATAADNASSQGPTQSEVKTYLEKVNDQYKLSRKKTMASRNTLEFCMGLKKV